VPIARTTEAIKLITKTNIWQRTALATAAAALFGLSAAPALALSLGTVVVKSALGEPLRAEIDIPDINAEEAASLKASVASPEAFRAAGLEYNAAMANTKATLLRRANGRAFISLQSDRPVNEPFVDMILEASWSSGRIVRDYTMLFDPPNVRAPSATLAAPAVVAPAVTPAPAALPAAPTTANRPARAVAAAKPISKPEVKAAPAAKVAAKPAATPTPVGDKQITVKSGDTATKIALAVKPANVSLDQMLVALLQANPNAFVHDNINRIKSGAVMNVPTQEQAQAIGSKEATQTVIAQSKDFGDFRKKLALNAPTAQVGVADRQASGSVQAKVDDKKPAANAPDKLTLSKGAVQAQAAVDKLAADKAAKDSAARNAEVAKNIKDLEALKATAAAASAAAAAKTAAATPAPAAVVAAPVAAAPAPVAPVIPTPAVVATAPVVPPVVVPAPVAKPEPVASAVAPVAAPTAKPVVAAVQTAAVAEPGLIDQLTENPLVPIAGGGLLALLAGFGLYRANRRKKAEQVDSSFLESRLQPDSFFGASGGQRVDTDDGAAGGASSMVYTPSQLDAADDVDPVAEADVYLAYGRDVQAEDILKEALKFNSGRVAIHQKLLEIYAKRKDTQQFEMAANAAFKVTGGDGPDWHRICDLGMGIDPTNPLYMPGGTPSVHGELTQPMSMQGALVGAATGLAAAGAASTFGGATLPMAMQTQATGAAEQSFDLDLDFSLDDENASVMQALDNPEQTVKMQPVDSGPAPLDMSFELPTTAVNNSAPAPLMSSSRVEPLDFDMSIPGELSNSGEVSRPATLEFEDFSKQAAVSFGTTEPSALATTLGTMPAAMDTNLMKFDMGGLSLELGDPNESTVVMAAQPEDPLATKLALAEEFSNIGDDDGARALIEEVMLEANGPMKARAQQALARLS
jgi:pilus assembly protein FimV